jgi:hypothetical protein
MWRDVLGNGWKAEVFGDVRRVERIGEDAEDPGRRGVFESNSKAKVWTTK